MDAVSSLPPPDPFPMPANAARFTEIVKREGSRLGHFIRRQVRDADEAEDILQDVLLEFYVTTDAIEQAGAWLFRVARNRIIDRARRTKREPLPSTDDDVGRSWLEENVAVALSLRQGWRCLRSDRTPWGFLLESGRSPPRTGRASLRLAGSRPFP